MATLASFMCFSKLENWKVSKIIIRFLEKCVSNFLKINWRLSDFPKIGKKHMNEAIVNFEPFNFSFWFDHLFKESVSCQGLLLV